MKKLVLAAVALILLCTPAFAGLDDFLSSLNVQARADLSGFAARVSAQFGVPEIQVRTVINTVREPADAFMVYQLGQMTRRPPETVVEVYQANRGKGWGVIAKRLGIKPGSAEFHALKRGEFVLSGTPAGGPGEERGKGRGKGHRK